MKRIRGYYEISTNFWLIDGKRDMPGGANAITITIAGRNHYFDDS